MRKNGLFGASLELRPLIQVNPSGTEPCQIVARRPVVGHLALESQLEIESVTLFPRDVCDLQVGINELYGVIYGSTRLEYLFALVPDV